MKFRFISKAGVDHGVYEGDTADEAFLAMIRDAGHTKLDETTGTIEDWIVEAEDEEERD